MVKRFTEIQVFWRCRGGLQALTNYSPVLTEHTHIRSWVDAKAVHSIQEFQAR